MLSTQSLTTLQVWWQQHNLNVQSFTHDVTQVADPTRQAQPCKAPQYSAATLQVLHCLMLLLLPRRRKRILAQSFPV
jgi:hypothetical protein